MSRLTQEAERGGGGRRRYNTVTHGAMVTCSQHNVLCLTGRLIRR